MQRLGHALLAVAAMRIGVHASACLKAASIKKSVFGTEDVAVEDRGGYMKQMPGLRESDSALLHAAYCNISHRLCHLQCMNLFAGSVQARQGATGGRCIDCWAEQATVQVGGCSSVHSSERNDVYATKLQV